MSFLSVLPLAIVMVAGPQLITSRRPVVAGAP